MTWLAVKQFLKKTWQFVVDQWLFFLALVIGVAGFLIGVMGNKNAKRVVDLQRKSEEEETEARSLAKEEAEEVLKKLDQDLMKLEESERKQIEKVREENKEEFEKEIIENRDKPLDDVAKELAAKYGLNKV